MTWVRALSAGLTAGAMALLASGTAAAQADGYVYLQCDFKASSPNQQAETIQLKIGRGSWYVFDAATGGWGGSLCKPDFTTGYRGECSFSNTRFELIATAGSVKQTTTISRTNGDVIRRIPGKADLAGVCRPVAPPPGKP